MKIANPIYDIVFKFLMEDNESAKIFISTVTGLNIISLETLPQELSIIIDRPSSSGIDLSINRLDFSAKILNEDGQEKVIIIELQKTRFISETVRFRRYIGKQYMNSKFSQEYTTNGGSEFQLGLPIFPIFILGEPYDELQNSPVTLIKMVSIDRYANKELKNDIYVKSLFHEGIIINIAALSIDRRDELEIMLSIFDQNNTDKNKHIMNIIETEFPTKFKPLLRRLQTASENVIMREVMTVEDEFLMELKEMDDRAKVQRKLKEVAIEEKLDAIRQKEEAQRQNEEAQRQNKEAQKLKEVAINNLKGSIKLLLKSNVSPETIASTLSIPIENVNSLIEK